MRKLLSLFLLLAGTAHAQSFVAQQFYGKSGGLSNLPISYTVQNAGDLLLLFAANDYPLAVSDSSNAWVLVQAANGGYTALYAATAKAAGTFTVTVFYPPNSTYAAVLFAEYAARLDQLLGSIATGQVITAGLPNPNNELIAEFGNIYGKWADYATTSGQTIRANSGSHQGIFLAEGTGQGGVVPANQWGTGIIAVSLLPPAPPLPTPVFKNFGILGGLVFCTACAPPHDDDTITGITPLLAGAKVLVTQLDNAGKSLGSISMIVDTLGHLSGDINMIVNFNDPLRFSVVVFKPDGVTQIPSLAETFAIEQLHLQGMNVVHLIIRLDQTTVVQVRGLEWYTTP